MRRTIGIFFLIALITTLTTLGCNSSSNQDTSAAIPTKPPADNIVESLPTEEQRDTPDENIEDFSPENFDRPTEITNQWLPLVPGRQYVFEGTTEEAGIVTNHQVIFTVTDLTKVIDGVESVVIWDRDFSEGELVETELAFFAQDNDGNVWRMGEYPEVYENGALVEAPAWISGLKNAVAGIMMPDDPSLDSSSYSQGWGPAVDFTDRAQIDQVGLDICVEAGCYENVIVTAEFSRSEPNAFQLKYYASGIGNIKVDWRGDDATRETLDLVEIRILSTEEMDQIRASALLLEQRAYQNSKEVYDQTDPAK